jgi:hypothetical protein
MNDMRSSRLVMPFSSSFVLNLNSLLSKENLSAKEQESNKENRLKLKRDSLFKVNQMNELKSSRKKHFFRRASFPLKEEKAALSTSIKSYLLESNCKPIASKYYINERGNEKENRLVEKKSLELDFKLEKSQQMMDDSFVVNTGRSFSKSSMHLASSRENLVDYANNLSSFNNQTELNNQEVKFEQYKARLTNQEQEVILFLTEQKLRKTNQKFKYEEQIAYLQRPSNDISLYYNDTDLIKIDKENDEHELNPITYGLKVLKCLFTPEELKSGFITDSNNARLCKINKPLDFLKIEILIGN